MELQKKRLKELQVKKIHYEDNSFGNSLGPHNLGERGAVVSSGLLPQLATRVYNKTQVT